MAEKSPPRSEPAPPAAEKKSLLQRIKLWQWAMIVVVGSVLAHAVLLFAGSLRSSSHIASASNEIDLGQYKFVNRDENAGIREAQFALHVQLLEGVSHPARARLELRQFRVQQDVEELLRQAHAADFDDPLLTELKRQLQEKINATLEMRAVGEVIITSLQLEGAPAAKPAAGVAQQTPEPFTPDTAPDAS